MTKKVYVVHEDWANEDDAGSAGWDINGVFDNLDAAKDCMKKAIQQAKDDGLDFKVHENEELFYSSYTDGWYDEAHYQITIEEKELNK